MELSRCTIWLVAACVVLAGCGDATAPQTQTAAEFVAEVPEYVAPSLAGYDVVVVVIDGLRADHVTAETTPILMDFARGGLSFENAASNSSHATQSLASLFTGRLPTAGGTIGVYEAEPHDATTTLAQHFERAGYYTGMLANNPNIHGTGFTKGFQEIDIARAGEPLDDDRLVQRAMEFLEDAGDDSVFLYVHFAGPLAVPQFATDDTVESSPSPERVEATAGEYRQAIEASHEQFRKLASAVLDAGRMEKTLFVVTSLHGFELFEHGGLGSGWTLYDEAIRVPLIFHAPGALHPSVEPKADLVSLVDVMPTLLALTGIELDNSPLEGRSLFRPGRDGFVYERSNAPRIAELVIPERCIVRSVTLGDHKYIASSLRPEPAARAEVAAAHKETANAYLDGSKPLPPLWGADAYEALFDLASDPRETNSLLGGEPARASELRAVLETYRARCRETGIAPRIATLFEVAPDPETLQNLESLGYL